MTGGARRTRTQCIVVVSLVLVLAVAAVVVTLDVLASLPATTYEVDRAELGVTERRLEQVADSLREVQLSVPPDRAAAVAGQCHLDSGDLFQPSAVIGWTPAQSQEPTVRRQVAEALERLGWTVGEETRFGNHEVSFTSPDGWTASGSLYATEGLPDADPYVGVEVRIDGAAPCFLN